MDEKRPYAAPQSEAIAIAIEQSILSPDRADDGYGDNDLGNI